MFDSSGSGLDRAAIAVRRAELIELLVSAERAKAAADAAQLDAIAEMIRQENATSADVSLSWTREEVAAALRIPATTAEYRIQLALQSRRIAATMSMLARGDLSLRHVQVLTEAVLPLDDSQVAEVERRVLPGAEALTAAQFQRRIRRAVLRIAPQAEEAAHQREVEARDVTYASLAHGMGELRLYTSAPEALSLFERLNRAARRMRALPGETRKSGQLRADLLVEYGSRAADVAGKQGSPESGTSGSGTPGSGTSGSGPQVRVTIAASTLAGLDDAPGELAGHGPIPAGLARQIANDPTARWRRLVTGAGGRLVAERRGQVLTDAGGLPLDYGRRVRRPPVNLVNYVVARDGTCRFPSCNVAAERCELDHIQPWSRGGTTSADNLQVLCKRHHRLKDGGNGWSVVRGRDGTTVWRSPTGHRYRKAANPPLTDPPVSHEDDPPRPPTGEDGSTSTPRAG